MTISDEHSIRGMTNDAFGREEGTLSVPTIRTLLVEDHDDYAFLIQRNLRSGAGRFSVEVAETLSDALRHLQESDVDVVLLDLNLPDSAGVETVTRVRELAPDVPIVVLTNQDAEDVALASLRARADDFLLKDKLDGRTLVRSIHLSIERHRVRTETERNASILAKDAARFRRILSTSTDGMVVISQQGTVLFANPAAARLLECPREHLRADRLGFPFGDKSQFVREFGGGRVVEVHVAQTEWDDQRVWIASLFDISEHKRYQADLEHVTLRTRELNKGLERLANVDPLTELSNRRGLGTQLGIEMQRARRNGGPLAAVLIDCDDFKSINSRFGHAVGDVVLKELARRLKESLRPSDHISRLGGDEFLALLPDTRMAEAFQVAERLRLAVSDSPMPIVGGSERVTISLAIEMVDDEMHGLDDLLSQTHLALGRSKSTGKNRVSTQDAGEQKAASRAENLVTALQDGTGLRVVREPIVRLRDQTVMAWEMLSRGPKGVFEAPRDFFRVATERGILTQVDRHCLVACLAVAAKMPRPVRCHVNVFPTTLVDTMPQHLQEIFAAAGDDLELCAEISEQQVVGDPSSLRCAVAALREAGVMLAIDDVGFGRSSLETLILLEPDVVKIDPRFVHGAPGDTVRQRSLHRLVDVVTAMGSEVIAEGIETQAEVDLLLSIGVEAGQGRLWPGTN